MTAHPFLFQPLHFGGLALRNRIVVPPMCQYTATPDGMPTDYHLVHYGSRALGGAGMLIIEATAVEPDGRISGRDLGIWSDEHVPALSRIARIIEEFGCVPAIQLAHAGRKCLPEAERMVAPSPIPFAPDKRVPAELSIAEIDGLVQSFAVAAKRAVAAGFKVLELHAAHGYLLHEFLSPLANQRQDEYGGSLQNRLRFPLQVAQVVRQAIPKYAMMTVRLSGDEFAEGGYSLPEMVQMSEAFVEAGCDMVHMSSGGSVPVRPEVWPGYQLQYARAVKQTVRVPVIGVGLLDKVELAEFALREGFCDLVAVGRGILRDPNWPVAAAQLLGAEPPVPENMQIAFRR